MKTIAEVTSEFLAHTRFAVTGVSRTPNSHGANVVYRRLRERGYEVFAVNPNTTKVEGDTSYPNLHAIPGGVDVVVIGTRPDRAEQTILECADLGITRVWMHRLSGAGSCSPEAAQVGRQHGVTVIEGGCPLMFGPTADGGHKVMRALFSLTGSVPRKVEEPAVDAQHAAPGVVGAS